MSLLNEIKIDNYEPLNNPNGICSGMVFVITGNVVIFENRSKLIQYIENRGGKVTSAISTKTDYLINNDVNSISTKNEKAKKLGISIISENEFLSLFGD